MNAQIAEVSEKWFDLTKVWHTFHWYLVKLETGKRETHLPWPAQGA